MLLVHKQRVELVQDLLALHHFRKHRVVVVQEVQAVSERQEKLGRVGACERPKVRHRHAALALVPDPLYDFVPKEARFLAAQQPERRRAECTEASDALPQRQGIGRVRSGEFPACALPS